MIEKKYNFLVLSLLILFTNCKVKDPSASPAPTEKQKRFGIFKVVDSQTVEANGDIGRRSLNNFNRLISQYPNIKRINIRVIPGSKDDETNLRLGLAVHKKGISTHVMDNGEIASGGVDFFLAGVKRTIGRNVKIGVHSWGGDGMEASDLRRNHPEHRRYINYYTQIGFTPKQASDFYFFTIDAAPARDIHWMTPAEIERYGLLTSP